jgi:hypothetical protein
MLQCLTAEQHDCFGNLNRYNKGITMYFEHRIYQAWAGER